MKKLTVLLMLWVAAIFVCQTVVYAEGETPTKKGTCKQNFGPKKHHHDMEKKA